MIIVIDLINDIEEINEINKESYSRSYSIHSFIKNLFIVTRKKDNDLFANDG